MGVGARKVRDYPTIHFLWKKPQMGPICRSIRGCVWFLLCLFSISLPPSGAPMRGGGRTAAQFLAAAGLGQDMSLCSLALWTCSSSGLKDCPEKESELLWDPRLLVQQGVLWPKKQGWHAQCSCAFERFNPSYFPTPLKKWKTRFPKTYYLYATRNQRQAQLILIFPLFFFFFSTPWRKIWLTCGENLGPL